MAAKKFRWRINGGSWNYETEELPYNLATVTAEDQVEVEPIGAASTVLPDNALGAIEMAAFRPVDIVMIGDSNQLFNLHGFDHGFGYALNQAFDCYASPVNNDGLSYKQGYGTEFTNPLSSGTLPTELEDFASLGGTSGYKDSGSLLSSGNNGTNLSTSPLEMDVNANLRGYYCYGTFPSSGGGSFYPAVRRQNSPFNTLVAPVEVDNTVADEYGSAVATVDLAAGSRNFPVGFKWELQGGTAATGENARFWQRIENRDASAGYSVSTLWGQGGASLYDAASTLQGYDDRRLANYFYAVRYIQAQRGLDPVVIVRICFGLNDRNETSQPSLGPDPQADPDSAEAYIDNLNAVVNRIKEIYTLNGWDQTGLYFLVTPSHRISDPDDTELLAYRSAVSTWAATQDRTSFVDFNTLMTEADASSSGWYDAGGNEHLTQTGYEQLALLELGI